MEPVVQPLIGHHDEVTAFVVADYPYSFKLRTQIRYWTEAAPKKGVRFVSQTMNPKLAGVHWNKPKKSTFARFAMAMYLDENGHVQTKGLSEYSEPSEIVDYLRVFGLEGTIMPDLKDLVVGRAKLYDGLASGKIVQTVTVNGVKRVDTPTPDEVARHVRQAEQWAAVRDMMA